ncbi:MAG: hypothetical protein M1829_001959 [Trizodia sp. TS-e1964]|nr:MAG: hypothetical protein M1829_001959 [Trizodia sp. TS-e1964]
MPEGSVDARNSNLPFLVPGQPALKNAKDGALGASLESVKDFARLDIEAATILDVEVRVFGARPQQSAKTVHLAGVTGRLFGHGCNDFGIGGNGARKGTGRRMPEPVGQKPQPGNERDHCSDLRDGGNDGVQVTSRDEIQV